MNVIVNKDDLAQFLILPELKIVVGENKRQKKLFGRQFDQ